MKRKFLAMCLLICLVFAGCDAQPKQQKHTITIYGTFDTVVTLTGYASEKTFQQTAGKVREKLEYYSMIFDAYREYDGMNNLCTLNRLGGQGAVSVPEPLTDLLMQYRAIDSEIGGTNIALGAVLFLWHDYRDAYTSDPESAAIPDDSALQQAAEHANFSDVIINEAESTVYYLDDALKLDLGAVAKGYAAQRIAEELQTSDMPSFILSLGGNVIAGDAPLDGRKAWSVSVQNPADPFGEALEILYVTNCSVVTSGDYQRYHIADGTRYHHIIDPKTLYPAQYAHGVTVVCQDSLLADYLSTALFVMPVEQGMALLEGRTGIEALWVTEDNTVQMTPGMREIAKSHANAQDQTGAGK